MEEFASPFVPRWERILRQESITTDASYDIFDEDELDDPDVIIIDREDDSIDFIHVVEFVNRQFQPMRMLVWFMMHGYEDPERMCGDYDNNDPIFLIDNML